MEIAQKARGVTNTYEKKALIKKCADEAVLIINRWFRLKEIQANTHVVTPSKDNADELTFILAYDHKAVATITMNYEVNEERQQLVGRFVHMALIGKTELVGNEFYALYHLIDTMKFCTY